jgi:hypothetical protein
MSAPGKCEAGVGVRGARGAEIANNPIASEEERDSSNFARPEGPSSSAKAEVKFDLFQVWRCMERSGRASAVDWFSGARREEKVIFL